MMQLFHITHLNLPAFIAYFRSVYPSIQQGCIKLLSRNIRLDLNLNCLHLLTPLRTVQRHHSALICVLRDPVRYIIVVVVAIVVVGYFLQQCV